MDYYQILIYLILGLTALGGWIWAFLLWRPIYQEKQITKKGFIKIEFIDPFANTKNYFYRQPDDDGYIRLKNAGEWGRYRVIGDAINFETRSLKGHAQAVAEIKREKIFDGDILREENVAYYEDAQKAIYHNKHGTPVLSFVKGITNPVVYSRQATVGETEGKGWTFVPIDAEDLENQMDLENAKGYKWGKATATKNPLADITFYLLIGIALVSVYHHYEFVKFDEEIGPVMKNAVNQVTTAASKLEGYLQALATPAQTQPNAFIQPNTPPGGG